MQLYPSTPLSLSLPPPSLSLIYFIRCICNYAAFLASNIPKLSKISLDVRIYLVFSLGGSRLFNTQSRHQKGKSFSSSVPSKSVIFFLHGPPWEPSVIMDGGWTVENSNGGYTIESFSALISASILEWIRLLWLTSFPDNKSPFAEAWDPNLCFLLANQWAKSPLRVSRARLTCKNTRMQHNLLERLSWYQ